MRDKLPEHCTSPQRAALPTPPWIVLRWLVAVPVLLGLAGTVTAQFQGLPPLGTSQGMNVSPVKFVQMGKAIPEKAPEKAADKGAGPILPLPTPAGPADPLANRPRLPFMGEKLGGTPQPSPEELKEYDRFVEKFIDPRNTLTVVENRTRLIILKQAPLKIQVADERIATVSPLEPKQLSLLGLRVGSTVLNLFFEDPKDMTQKTISYLVRVIPDPEQKERLERVYKALEAEINKLFCNSQVRLSLVGDKVAVSGQAKDIFEGTQILRIVRANAPGEAPLIPVNSINVEDRPEPGNPNAATPGLSDFLSAGGANVINLLRVPGEQQVMLKVIVAEVNRSAARSIGLNFNITNNQGVTVFSQRTGLIAQGGSGAVAQLGGLGGFGGLGGLGGAGAGGLGNALFPLGLITNNLPVNLDGGQIPLAINALRELNYARSLAEPNLVAMNGQTASFQAGGQFPVPVVAQGGGGFGSVLQGVNFVPFGVQLTFTPFITNRDRIRLQVQADVSTRDLAGGANIGGAGVPGLNTRNFNTTVELREGQTLAVAGLIQNNLGSQAERVPGVGDIPILNRIFGFDRIQSGEQELIVLITPELVHPLEKKELLPLPGSDLLEPSDLEFYVLGRMENKQGREYRSPIRNTVGRMKAYHTLENMYLFGPAGLSDAAPISESLVPSNSIYAPPPGGSSPPPILHPPYKAPSVMPPAELPLPSPVTYGPASSYSVKPQ